jgi:hypothetical protein
MSQGRCCTWTQVHTTENGENSGQAHKGGHQAFTRRGAFRPLCVGGSYATFSERTMSARLVFGVENLPLGMPVELKTILEVPA